MHDILHKHHATHTHPHDTHVLNFHAVAHTHLPHLPITCGLDMVNWRTIDLVLLGKAHRSRDPHATTYGFCLHNPKIMQGQPEAFLPQPFCTIHWTYTLPYTIAFIHNKIAQISWFPASNIDILFWCRVSVCVLVETFAIYLHYIQWWWLCSPQIGWFSYRKFNEYCRSYIWTMSI